MFDEIISFIKSLYPDENPVPLHAPRFFGNEKKYLIDCIDSTYVSYVGQYVSRFEEHIEKFTGAKYAVAVDSGTSALHIALLLAGVNSDVEVLTQPLTFVATANAISYCNAHPVFIDVEKTTLGLDPQSLADFLKQYGNLKADGCCYNQATGRKDCRLCAHAYFWPPVSDRSGGGDLPKISYSGCGRLSRGFRQFLSWPTCWNIWGYRHSQL